MKFHGTILTIPLIGLLVGGINAGEILSAPVRTGQVYENYDDRPAPSLTGGLLAYPGGEDGSLVIYSTNGDQPKIIAQPTIRPEGAAVIRLNGVAGFPSGVIAVCGSAITGAGASSGYIAFLQPGGAQLIVQLPNMAPVQIVSASDGTVWVLASQMDSSRNELAVYDLVRHYSTDGKLLGSALPRSSFAAKSNGFALRPSLSASKDSIGVYLDGVGMWIELGNDGTETGRWQVPKTQLSLTQRLRFDRLDLMTSSNQIVRTSYISGKEKTDHFTRVEHLLKSGNLLAASPVDTTALPSRTAFLAGVDGDELVWVSNRGKYVWNKIE